MNNPSETDGKTVKRGSLLHYEVIEDNQPRKVLIIDDDLADPIMLEIPGCS